MFSGFEENVFLPLQPYIKRNVSECLIHACFEVLECFWAHVARHPSQCVREGAQFYAVTTRVNAYDQRVLFSAAMPRGALTRNCIVCLTA